MQKTITVQFRINNTEVPVLIAYNIQMDNDIQTISCFVNKNANPTWLQLGKFELKSQYDNGMYVALFNDMLNKKNMATALFVDQAYTDIMGKEKMRVYNEFIV